MIRLADAEELLREMDGGEAGGGISHERVSRALDAELRGEMARRRIVDRLRKEERAGGAGALLDDLLVELARVHDPAIGHGKDHRRAARDLRGHLQAGVFQRIQRGGDGEVGNGAGAAEARIAAEVLDELRRHRDARMGAPGFRIEQRPGFGSFAIGQSLPDGFEVCAQRSDPAHACDRRAHEDRSRTTEALAPPKPKEFETTQRTRASRASLATTFSFHAGSGSW